jgi:hypothetical protein
MKKFAFAAFLALGLLALLAPPQAFAADEKPFTLHGELRFRADYVSNSNDFDSDVDDAAMFFPYRARIAAEGHFTDDVSAWIEFQNTGLFGEQGLLLGPFDASAPRRLNDIRSDTQLYQAVITLDKLWSDSFSLRFGRQEMVLGNEFLFGDEDFYSGISHDGIVGVWDHKKWDLTVWYDRAVENVAFQFADQDIPPAAIGLGDSSDVDHFGGYLTFGVGKNQVVDVYLFNVNDRPVGGQYQTVGGRYAKLNWDKGFIWNAEVALQFGTAATIAGTEIDQSGMGGEALFGFNFGGGKNVHRVYGKVEYATGDDGTSADENEGFINNWGEVHDRTGKGDWFQVASTSSFVGGGTNGGLMAVSVGYTGHFNQKHEVGAAFWDYSLEEDNGSALGDGLGTAFDLWYGYNYSKNVTFEAAYSNLSPDDALTGGGGAPDDAVERLYGQVRLRF